MATGTTDASGRTQVDVFSAAQFGREVVVAVSVAKSDKIAGGFGFAKIRTKKPGEATVFKITTTRSNKETADSLFDVIVTARDSLDKRAFQFEQKLKVKITSSAKGTLSWAGKLSEVPDGAYECEFVSGQCTLPGGPYQFAAIGEYSMEMDVPEGGFPKSSATILVGNGKPERLVFVEGLIDSSKKPLILLDNYSLRQSTKTQFSVALLDKAGNLLGSPDNLEFSASKEPFGFKSSDKAGSYLFDVLGTTPSGDIKIEVNDKTSGKKGSLILRIQTRGATKFQISSQDFLNDNISVRKVGCFHFGVKAIDDAGIEDENFTKNVDLTLSLNVGVTTGSHIPSAKL